MWFSDFRNQLANICCVPWQRLLNLEKISGFAMPIHRFNHSKKKKQKKNGKLKNSLATTFAIVRLLEMELPKWILSSRFSQIKIINDEIYEDSGKQISSYLSDLFVQLKCFRLFLYHLINVPYNSVHSRHSSHWQSPQRKRA